MTGGGLFEEKSPEGSLREGTGESSIAGSAVTQNSGCWTLEKVGKRCKRLLSFMVQGCLRKQVSS